MASVSPSNRPGRTGIAIVETLYVFLDESGDLGERGDRFFNLTTLVTRNPKPVENLLKKLRQKRLRKKLKELPEIKASKTEDALRRRVLEGLLEVECGFVSLVFDKTDTKRIEDKDGLYNELAGRLISSLDAREATRVQIVYDQRHTNPRLQKNFERHVQRSWFERNPKIGIDIRGLKSFQHGALGAVDFVAWAIHRQFNANDASFAKLIAPKLSITRWPS